MAKMSLSEAAGKGNLALVKKLLAQGAKADGSDCDPDLKEDGIPFWRPLSQAAQKGYLEVMKALLDAGADVDEVNADGDTAVINASFFAQPKAVELLLARGADARHMGSRGNSLQVVRFDGEHRSKAVGLVKLLLAAGCSPTVLGTGKQTALDRLTDLRPEDGPISKGFAKPALDALQLMLPHAGKHAADAKKAIRVLEKAVGKTSARPSRPAKATAKNKPAAKAKSRRARESGNGR